jgi:hypothetical protein
MNIHLLHLERVELLLNLLWVRKRRVSFRSSLGACARQYQLTCAKVGVNRLHVAGSALRSYTFAGQVVWTDKFCAKTILLPDPPGAEAERMGWTLLPKWLSVGAETFI